MEMEPLTILSLSLPQCIDINWKGMSTYTKHFSTLTRIAVGELSIFLCLLWLTSCLEIVDLLLDSYDQFSINEMSNANSSLPHIWYL